MTNDQIQSTQTTETISKVFQSQHLHRGEYDPATGMLKVQFSNGSIYAYHSVPQTTADTFFQSQSPGTYLHSKIRGVHGELKLADGQTKSGRRSTRTY